MKISFIGAGRVGSASAFACIHHLNIDEIALIDIVEDLAVGEAMDLKHSAFALDKQIDVMGGSDFSLMKNSDLIVVTAGLPRKPGMSRLDLTVKNAEIIRSVAREIMKNCPGGKVLVVTNPLDIMTYVMWKETGKSRNEVFGMGSLLDTVRLRERLASSGLKPKKAFMMGEHGDSMFSPKSLIELEGHELERAVNETREIAMEVIRRKGATVYAPATCVYRMVRAVIEDTKEEIPTSVVLDGEYGIKDVAVGVPAIIGRNGVERIIEYDLSDDDLKSLRRSVEILRQRLNELGY